ncbi:MAG: YdcF family protein [Halanaerobiales bacterium]
MAKTFLSPLFIIIIYSIVFIIYSLIHSSKKDRIYRYALVFFLVITIIVSILSMPVISVRLANYLESPYINYPDQLEVDHILVLSGGLLKGPSRGDDILGESSQARVVRGVRVFKESTARYLIVQGRLAGPDPERMTDNMQRLAVEMGVPEEMILKEPYSRNTFQHPIELLKMDQVRETDSVAVVTSAWHLNRAVGEYERYFSEVIAIPAEFFSFTEERGLLNWLPGISTLKRSTNLLHEIIGLWWYRLKHLFS